MLFTRDRTGETQIEQVAKWVFDQNEELQSLEDSVDIFENQLVDSLQITSFIFLIEELSGRAIPIEEIVPEAFKSLAIINQTFFRRTEQHSN